MYVTVLTHIFGCTSWEAVTILAQMATFLPVPAASGKWHWLLLQVAGEPEKDAYVIRSPQNEGRALAESCVCTGSVVSTIGVCRNKKSFSEKS